MTREEAIKVFSVTKEAIQKNEQEIFDRQDIPLIDMAISALEREEKWLTDLYNNEPSDLISRADLLRVVQAPCNADGEWSTEEVVATIDIMPSVSAERVGEWKIDEYGIYHCPFCQAINNTVYKSYCPNCGAKMKGGAE